MEHILAVFVLPAMKASVEKSASVMIQTVIENPLINICLKFQVFFHVDIFLRIDTLNSFSRRLR